MVVSFVWKARHVSPESVPSVLLEGAIFSFRIEASEHIGTKSKGDNLHSSPKGVEFSLGLRNKIKRSLSLFFITVVNLHLR